MTWSHRKKEVLVNALKSIVSTGWKYENGFCHGYLQQLEAYMLKAFPNTDLKAEPHINSKIHVLKKKYYASLVGMMEKNGFGLDYNKAKVTVDENQNSVWDEYVKIDPTAKNMRYKWWPFLPRKIVRLVSTQKIYLMQLMQKWKSIAEARLLCANDRVKSGLWLV
ncbi:UNVERIFIED_CONTAM: hypothetical protein Slati_2184200 [Sesamum latifolium]|uniref:Myb/SANT-like domain-containing protein n=1 Tax=Sesamum latifolium TaxID=2727402 RepID=A0AAW2WWY7_9LAMI